MAGLQNIFRPKDFDEMIGNKTVLAAIRSLLNRPLDEQPRTYLLTGPPGTGKTTVARIIAKKLNVSNWDFVEVNSGNNRGIETAREIISQISYWPVQGKITFFLLDEVHKTTKDFQDAMLKPLEDTPSHIRFVLCTTNPEKLLEPLKARCDTFSFTRQPPGNIKQLLRNVASRLGHEVNPAILDNISENCDGLPREALKMLDQVLDLSPDDIEGKLKEISDKDEESIALCRVLAKIGSWKTIADVLRDLKDDPENTRRLVLKYFRKALLNSGDYYHAFIITCFEKPFYDSGKSGLARACFMSYAWYSKQSKERKGK